MTPMANRTINTNGAAIQLTESGAGKSALVFLHYWGGSSRTWRGVTDRLGGWPCCVALDQRGWGGSVATDGRYDLAAMADDAEAVVHALGLTRYVLVGHSMGGKVLAGRPLPPELREQVIEDTLRGAAGAKRAWTERGMIEDVSAGLDRVTIPVTVLIGGRDQVEHETALRESFARFLPHATFRVLRRIGDLSPLEASDALAEACTVFLNEL